MTTDQIRARLANMIDPDEPPTQKQFDCIVRAVEYGKLDLDNPQFDTLTKSWAMSYIKAGVENSSPPAPVAVQAPTPTIEDLLNFGKNTRSKSDIIASIRAGLDELEAL